MRERIARFMIGRNGQDQLNLFLTVLCLVLIVLGAIFRASIGSFFSGLALALLLLTWFRMLSKNLLRRRAECDHHRHKQQYQFLIHSQTIMGLSYEKTQ